MSLPKLPNFMFLNNKEELPGVELILFTKQPFYIAQVYTFHTQHEELLFLQQEHGKMMENILCYRIYIVFRGTIGGKLPLLKDTTEHIKHTLNQMARFYETERINKKPGNYLRYKLQS